MAKEWILNQSMNRWGLNKKRSVGPVSELIRKCQPKTQMDWQEYYYDNVHDEKYIEELGKKLYIKITEVIQFEIEEVTEEDCINYIKEVVIKRTYDGYVNEIQTVYGQLQEQIVRPIEAAPDEWDRLFNVDFFIKVNEKYIGIQIKPITFEHTFEQHRWQMMQDNSHKKFKGKYGGNVYTIFSAKKDKKKYIVNADIIPSINDEIQSLLNEKK